MKKHIISIAFLFITSFIFGQSPIAIGQKQLNAGIGFSSWGIPAYVGLDVGVHEDVTVGGEITGRTFQDNIANTHYNHAIIGFSGNGNYHFNRLLKIPKKYDFYAGVNAGFYIWSSPDNYPGTHTSGVGANAQVGGRIYLTEKFGLNMEFGGGNAFSGGKCGISLKL